MEEEPRAAILDERRNWGRRRRRADENKEALQCNGMKGDAAVAGERQWTEQCMSTRDIETECTKTSNNADPPSSQSKRHHKCRAGNVGRDIGWMMHLIRAFSVGYCTGIHLNVHAHPAMVETGPQRNQLPARCFSSLCIRCHWVRLRAYCSDGAVPLTASWRILCHLRS
jgi:hypothetical protein